MIDLSLILAGIIVFGVGAYVILDGFDLGVGILLILAAVFLVRGSVLVVKGDDRTKLY